MSILMTDTPAWLTSAGSLDTRTFPLASPFFQYSNNTFFAYLDSYIVYGPLSNGVTTTVFESTPIYPTPSRYWQTVDKYKLTQFYSAPTAIRLLRRLGAEHVQQHDLSSLRVIGTVGEPINPEAWNWYNENVGRRQCAIVDTFWQTETGSIVITPFPGAVETKPGSATVPFLGIDPVILDPQSGKVHRSFIRAWLSQVLIWPL
jgi:acetyl-CoA synthetase